MNLKNTILVFFFLILASSTIKTQNDTLFKLSNPSFEGLWGTSKIPFGWFNCGFTNESPPDTQPNQFDVKLPPKDGRSYLGLVVRDNNTYEAVGQKLKRKLQKDSTYQFSISLAKSSVYNSESRLTGKDTNFDKSVVLEIYLSNSYCKADGQLLFQSPIIEHQDWRDYTITFKAEKSEYSFMTFFAYYVPSAKVYYNGNILIDNLTPIKLVKMGK
jgi:hypothetical protein